MQNILLPVRLKGILLLRFYSYVFAEQSPRFLCGKGLFGAVAVRTGEKLRRAVYTADKASAGVNGAPVVFQVRAPAIGPIGLGHTCKLLRCELYLVVTALHTVLLTTEGGNLLIKLLYLRQFLFSHVNFPLQGLLP